MLQFILGVLFASLLNYVWGLLLRHKAGVNDKSQGGEELAHDTQEESHQPLHLQDAIVQETIQPEADAANSKLCHRGSCDHQTPTIRRSLSADAAQSIRSKPLPLVGITQHVSLPPDDGDVEDGQERDGAGSLRAWAGSLDGGGQVYRPSDTSPQQTIAAAPSQLQQQQRVILRRSGRWLVRWESRPSRLSLQ
eukprot:434989-Pelagomonas_calceolata.AAC.1